jgi:hypothetical protein
MPKDTPQVDHRAEALRLLSDADDARCNDEQDLADVRFHEAFVLSNLAIAEGQERVAKALESHDHWLEEIANQLSRAQS